MSTEEAATGQSLPHERDAVGRIVVEDGCIRGTPSHIRLQQDLLFPEEANVKDPGEYLLETGEWKKGDMFFEYRIKEGEELRYICIMKTKKDQGFLHAFCENIISATIIFREP
jgi:hypothetical protein